MMVSPASRMLSAISFGVFCRLAPSTMAIMRSRKVSPGSLVMRTTIQSERTRVPPVTALRSPPASRITGALSPVMALSSTDAMPSTISPSLAMNSPAVTSTMSPLRRSALVVLTYLAEAGSNPRRGASASFFAVRSRRARLRLSACAFPRPSAMASAKLANRTVNQSQRDTAKMNQAGASPRARSAWMKSAVVRTLPTSTTNMTGLRTCMRGSSLRNESTSAPRTVVGSNSERALACVDMREGVLASGGQHQLLDDRSQRERRDEGERPNDDDDADQHRDEERRVRRERPGARRHELLPRQRAGDGERGDGEPVARHQQRDAAEQVVEGNVGVEAREGAAVVVAHGAEGVEDLAEPVRARVGAAREPGRHHRADRRADQHDQRRQQDDERGHLHLVGLDLLAEILRGAAHHEPGHEDRDDGEDQHAVEARADAAVDHLAELDHEQGHEAAERHEGIVHRVDRAVRRARRGGGPEGGVGDAEPHLLALHVAARRERARGLVHAERREARVARVLGPLAEREHG